MNLRSLTASIAFAAVSITAAHAAPPTSLAATTWTMQINRDIAQLVITHQGGPGTAGGPTCRLLIGTIGNAPVRGWYCFESGRFQLLHNNVGTANTVRVFTGNVSDDIVGQTLYMAGTVSIQDSAFGTLGEFNFSGTR